MDDRKPLAKTRPGRREAAGDNRRGGRACLYRRPPGAGRVQWPRRESNPQSRQALDLAALPVCVLGRKFRVQELHLGCRGYEPQLGLAPPEWILSSP